MPILYFRLGDTGSWSKAKPMISRLLGRLQKPANASRASKPQMARFIPNAEIHEPCAMGAQIRGGVIQQAVVRTPRTKKAPAIYRGLGTIEGRLARRAVNSSRRANLSRSCKAENC